MFAVKRLSLSAATALLWIQLAGCASVPPPAPGSMSDARAQELATQAERALAANDVRKASERYIDLVAGQPDNAQAWFRLGTIYLRTNQLSAAQRAFEECLRADPSMTRANANLAMAHLAQFRMAAKRAVVSPGVTEANRAALLSLLEDVNHFLPPVATVAGTRK